MLLVRPRRARALASALALIARRRLQAPVAPPLPLPPRAPRPRAAPAAASSVPPLRAVLWSGPTLALALALAASLALLAVAAAVRESAMSLRELRDFAAEQLRALGEPDPEDIAAILSPWSHFGEENGGGVATRGGVLLPPSCTLVLAWERAAADAAAYAPKRGRTCVPRPGLAALLLACADADVELVVWAREGSAAAAAEALQALVHDEVLPRDAKRYEAFVDFVRRAHANALAGELRAAEEEGRAPRFMAPFIEPLMAQPLYEKTVLRIAAVLGREHCYAAPVLPASPAAPVAVATPASPPRLAQRPLGLLLSNRRLEDVLLVDADAEAVQSEWSDALRGAAESGRGGGGGVNAAVGAGDSVMIVVPFVAPQPGEEARADPTLQLVAALLEDFGAMRKAAGGGSIRGFVRELAAEGAAAGGLGPLEALVQRRLRAVKPGPV